MNGRMFPARGAGLLLGMLCLPPAGATLQVVEQAFELRAQQVALPDVAEAPLTVRTCPDCKATVLRVTGGTQWFVGAGSRQAQSQAAVMEVFRQVAPSSRTLVYVYYEPGSGQVTRIVVDPRSSEGGR